MILPKAKRLKNKNYCIIKNECNVKQLTIEIHKFKLKLKITRLVHLLLVVILRLNDNYCVCMSHTKGNTVD